MTYLGLLDPAIASGASAPMLMTSMPTAQTVGMTFALLLGLAWNRGEWLLGGKITHHP